MPSLSQTECQPCRAHSPPASDTERAEWLAQIPGWAVEVRDGVMQLERVLKFKDFASALAFTNAVGAIAEAEDHHPALLTEWGKVTVTWWTHSIRGVHLNDFIMAARTDALATAAEGHTP